nr:MAG TPA: hypothetical protein [Caudoviricetes sp.]
MLQFIPILCIKHVEKYALRILRGLHPDRCSPRFFVAIHPHLVYPICRRKNGSPF